MVYNPGMEGRRNEYDVTNRVNVTEPDAVCNEVCRLLSNLYPKRSQKPIQDAFRIVSALFQGTYPGYHPCDTPYHDLQHTMDVSLAMARLLCGYEMSAKRSEKLGAELVQLGLVVALFHDCGYVRRLGDRRNSNGAAYTKRHVSRGARFLARILPGLGMAQLVPVARKLIHFTGYEVAVPAIPLRQSEHRVLGKLLGSADLIAQMSDRCYLEKCRDRLYLEFVAAGFAGDSSKESLYRSPEDLIFKSPNFFSHVLQDRLGDVMGGMHSYAGRFFLPYKNYYQEALEQNYEYLNRVVDERDVGLLRRQPPWTLRVNQESVFSLS
jgi:hypothetical protein